MASCYDFVSSVYFPFCYCIPVKPKAWLHVSFDAAKFVWGGGLRGRQEKAKGVGCLLAGIPDGRQKGELWTPIFAGELKSRLNSVTFVVKVSKPAGSERGKPTGSSQLSRAGPRAPAAALAFPWLCQLGGRLLVKFLLLTPDYEMGSAAEQWLPGKLVVL